MKNFIKRLYDKYININIFPYDKLLHFIAGMLLAIPGIMLFGISLDAVAPALLIGILKEIYDFFNQPEHSPELSDFACTAIGGLIVVYLMRLL